MKGYDWWRAMPELWSQSKKKERLGIGLLILSSINHFPYPVNDGSARKDEQWKTKQKRTCQSHSTNVNKYVIMAVVLCNVLVDELSKLKKNTTVNAGQKQGIVLKSGFSKVCVNILTLNSLFCYCEMSYWIKYPALNNQFHTMLQLLHVFHRTFTRLW